MFTKMQTKMGVPSGGSSAAVGPSFLAAGIGSAQTSTALEAIEFDVVFETRGGNITLDASTNVGRLSLVGDKTYLIVACVSAGAWGGTTSNGFELFNITTAAAEAGSQVRAWPPSVVSSASGGGSTLVRVVSPTVDTDYEIRTRSTNSFTTRVEATSLSVVELG